MLLFLFGFLIFRTVHASLATECEEPIMLYESLKCKPIYGDGEDSCPKKFDCSHYKDHPLNKCVYNGTEFNLHDEIETDVLKEYCLLGCMCDTTGNFECAQVACGDIEWSGPECHLKEEFSTCCDTQQVCPPFETTCSYNGTTYHVGQSFGVPNCIKCICNEGFTGEIVEPYCKRFGCTDEINHRTDIQSNCAPVYHGDSNCCPYTWTCPDIKNPDQIEKSTDNEIDEDLHCVFGDTKLNVGDNFNRTRILSAWEVHTTICKCRIPPFLTCNFFQKFDKDKAPAHIRPYLS